MNPILVALVVAIVVGAVAFVLGGRLQQQAAEKQVTGARGRAETVIEEARRESEIIRKTASLEAKDEWFKAKQELDKESQATRKELLALERKASDRDLALAKRVEVIESKDRDLKKLETDLAAQTQRLAERGLEVDKLIRDENQKLERIAGMSSEEARRVLMTNIEGTARIDAAKLISEIKEEAARTADREAQKIVLMAIQRSAADHALESTVSVVSLPNDEMKGRIIGREGRNIRAFETVSGIDVIIDDTPEAVILSGFDPVKREVARRALEKLVQDGRIHPGRIEEVVEKARKEMEDEIRTLGDEAAFELKLHAIHPELLKLMGRLRYRTSYGQNILNHSKEVGYLCGMMAAELGFDEMLARRCGFLHDIGKAVTHETEGTHPSIGKALGLKYGESDAVVHAIGHHHDDLTHDDIYTVLVQSADSISGARPGARRETLETYVKRLEKLESLAESFSGVEKCYAIQAGREIRVMIEPSQVDDARSTLLAAEIARKIEGELQYPGQIRVVVIRETRAVDYAK
ncbi:MAG: ribonuclease Y [Candidatus Eisenbacteria bacterium]|nr:ribonuclease Y [Candidatus Eisenbacteria bacterium]